MPSRKCWVIRYKHGPGFTGIPVIKRWRTSVHMSKGNRDHFLHILVPGLVTEPWDQRGAIPSIMQVEVHEAAVSWVDT